ncbi:MAG: SusC/RagA family TonB-linked outer membrane protein [Gemmatimonadota bacterium]|jgi:TonB-linked SusC/RagA family outer membrane protein
MRRRHCLSATLLAALTLLPVTLAAQATATLTGQVAGPAGEPLVSAAVHIHGLNLGTLTNEQGRYLVIVPASRVSGQRVTVTASLIGHTSQSHTVTLDPGTITLNFILSEDPLKLSEIVVTGQGTQQERRKLGVAISSVGGDQVQSSQEANVVAALAGKAPNVQVTSSSGDPGSSAYIRIRGAASIVAGTQPLFVVDGTPITNATNYVEGSTGGTIVSNRAIDLNPEDIANIEILKGAAAAALYGSRAANGVVLITTKTGRPGSSRVTFKSSAAFDEVSATVPLQMSYGQGLVDLDDLTSNISPTSSVTWGPQLSGSTPVYDHATEMYRTGHRYENNLTWSGGSERTTYYLSVGRLDHGGVITGPQKYDRTTVRLKGTHAFSDVLRIGGNFAYTDGLGDFVQQGSNISGIQLGALRTPPEFNNLPYMDPETGLHRSYRYPNPTVLATGRGYDNPFWIANEILNSAKVGRAFGNITATYEPMPWLSFNLVAGGDYANDERQTLFPKSSSNYPDGAVLRANFVNKVYDETLTATARRTLLDWMDATVTLGQNMNQAEYIRYQVDGSQLIWGTDQLDFSVSKDPNEYRETVRTDGWFSQLQLDMLNQLTLTGNFRWDGSNTFGAGTSSRFFYPGVSASWRFTQLNDFNGLLSFGRVRASWGVTGRQPPPFSNVSAYTTGAVGWDGYLDMGLQSIYMGNEGVYSQGRLGNDAIKPERETEFETGVDLAFLNDRVSVGVTYYDRKTTDAIIGVPVPPSTGYTSKYENVAGWTNKGWEATLDLTPIRRDNFTWTIGGQWSTNTSCVKEMGGANDYGLNGFTDTYTALVKPDEVTGCYQFGVIYGTDFIRFGRGSFVGGQDIDAAYPNAARGTVYIGADGFPVEDPAYRVLGDPNPDWLGSVRTTINLFRTVRIGALVDIKQGGDMWNGTKGALMYFGTHKASEPMHGAGQTVTFDGEGPGAGTPVVLNWDTWTLNGIGSGFTGPAAQFVEDASFVKLREISLSYSVPSRLLRPFGFSTAEITLAGRNLRTWTDYTGIDPESNLTGPSTGRGLDYFNNPQTRSWVVGVSITH